MKPRRLTNPKLDPIRPYISRASDILAQVAKVQRSSLPSVEQEAKAMKAEAANVSALNKVFTERSKAVLKILRQREHRR